MKLVVFVAVLFLIGCVNSNNNKPTVTTIQRTIIGLWKVKLICETDFAIDDNDTLRGTFCDSLNKQFIQFTNDSIYYLENKTVKDTYKYSKLNDTILNVQNINTGVFLKMYIQNLTIENLKIKNIRIDSNRMERYELKIDCTNSENK